MKPLKDYCSELAWSVSELARQAGISWPAASNAYNQEPVQDRTKRDICRALSQAMGREIKVTEVQWEQE